MISLEISAGTIQQPVSLYELLGRKGRLPARKMQSTALNLFTCNTRSQKIMSYTFKQYVPFTWGVEGKEEKEGRKRK